jgi:hypothetical protein
MIDSEQNELAGYWGEGEPPGETLPADEYDEIINDMVRDFAPSRFAIVQHWGAHTDGRIAAWGFTTGDHTDIIDAEAGGRFRSDSIRLAIRLYSRKPYLTASVVWVDPEPQPDEE